jgi:predicted DNA-binding transcriptional regulator AlpA
MSATDDKLWTAADLAAFLGLAQSTVTGLASKQPKRLPPRVRALSSLRWSPEVCREWVLKQSSTQQGGRPRG